MAALFARDRERWAFALFLYALAMPVFVVAASVLFIGRPPPEDAAIGYAFVFGETLPA